MLAYFLRRLLLVVPTLFGILLLNFAIVQLAPGGPVDQIIAQLKGTAVDATARFSGATTEVMSADQQKFSADSGSSGSAYRGAQGLDPKFIEELNRQFGFDKPLHERFFKMVGDYLQFDFGTSYFRSEKVTDLILSKLPVSISLGLWTTLLVYLISIPLGIRKAVRSGSAFDTWTSIVISVGYAIPGFLLAVMLIVLFAGGRYFDIFPLRGLVSDNFDQLSALEKVADYFWHLALPLFSMVISGFATLTLLTRNSFLEEINKQYVVTARAKGLTETRVLYKHVFRNAMLVVVAGLPGAFVHMLFTSALLIEITFALDGLGLLAFESALKRDYPVIFGSLFIFTLIGLIVNILGDMMYAFIDPRIDFEKREA